MIGAAVRGAHADEALAAAGSAGFRLEHAVVRLGGLTALDGIDLDVAAGEALALVGPSGAGKTTLLRLLNGTVRPVAGRVLIGGRSPAELSRRELRAVRATIGFIPQDFGLIPNLRASQNVLAGRVGRQSFFTSARMMLWPPRAELARAHALLTRVGIGGKVFERVDQLSGGQRQRVAVARALYQQPAALLADEPVSSVDPARARDTVELLTRISREERLTLCMSLHNLELARAYFPRLVGLRSGRVVFDAPAASVGEAEFHALFDLRPDELLADGA